MSAIHHFPFTIKRKIYEVESFFRQCSFSSFAAKSAVCQSTYTEGYNRGYGLGRSNTVSSVQTLTNDYVQAENGDLVGYAQGLLDGFNAGVLKGPIINPKITVSAGGGGIYV